MRRLFIVLPGLLGCSNTFVNVGQDASVEEVDVISEDRTQAVDADHPDLSTSEVSDAPFDLPQDEATVVDVGGDGMTDTAMDLAEDGVDPACPRDPPSGPPVIVNRSCRTGGGPAWHCQEVAYCGGSFRMGSTDAWEVIIPRDGRTLRMRDCDVHQATVRGGYVDAYEVTVARFRAWVNAGFPSPRGAISPDPGENYFNGLRWSSGANGQLTLPNRATAFDRVPGMMATDAMCTWSPTPGVNDDLPINCVPYLAAVAFCWWDGKHLITEPAWEYVATNRGTTATPFGPTVAPERSCTYGDVGGYSGHCPRNSLPMRVGSHPAGVTRDPPGIHDLWGGMQEYALGFRSPHAELRRLPFPPICKGPAEPTIDGRFELMGGSATNLQLMLRGAAWFQSAMDFGYFAHAATREGPTLGMNDSDIGTRSVRVGIRCARWVPEPRD